MQRIGQATVRVFKALAGVQKDEPVSSYLVALYGFLFLAAMALVLLWAVGGLA